jgi:hypothetical protein
MICNAYSSGRIAVIDRGINVHHRPGTGYSPASAKQEMRKFLEQLTINEKVVYEALYAYIALRRKKAARLAKKGRFSLLKMLPKQLPWGVR